jgi:PleD family two-component response regulator
VKVLILEDDKWFADSLGAILKPEFDVDICYNPEQIFSVIEKWQPDVLLADVILGAKNLFVLLNEMQSYVDTRALPVVILSTAAKQIKIKDVAQYNVKKVLCKAEITPKVLRDVMMTVFESESVL